jgi:hypothetical protein
MTLAGDARAAAFTARCASLRPAADWAVAPDTLPSDEKSHTESGAVALRFSGWLASDGPVLGPIASAPRWAPGEGAAAAWGAAGEAGEATGFRCSATRGLVGGEKCASRRRSRGFLTPRPQAHGQRQRLRPRALRCHRRAAGRGPGGARGAAIAWGGNPGWTRTGGLLLLLLLRGWQWQGGAEEPPHPRRQGQLRDRRPRRAWLPYLLPPLQGPQRRLQFPRDGRCRRASAGRGEGARGSADRARAAAGGALHPSPQALARDGATMTGGGPPAPRSALQRRRQASQTRKTHARRLPPQRPARPTRPG